MAKKKKVAKTTKKKTTKKTAKKITPKAKQEKAPDTRLSYSSAVLVKNCERKYYYYKALGLPKDPDSEQNEDAFNWGKAFHYVPEMNNHTEEDLMKHLDAACKAFSVEQYKPHIHAALLRYLQVHKKSGLTAVKNELAMSNNEFIGYVDSVMVDDDGGFWIVDLKTAGRLSDITLSKLHNDVQLNLYAYFHKEIAGVLELDPKKFRGCRYRVTTKPTLKQKSSESYVEFVKRLAKNAKSYDVIIPKEKMNPEEFYREHMRLHEKTLLIRSGEIEPCQNFSQCDSYFRPCEYFSRCHNKTYTELQSEIQMLTSNNV